MRWNKNEFTTVARRDVSNIFKAYLFKVERTKRRYSISFSAYRSTFNNLRSKRDSETAVRTISSFFNYRWERRKIMRLRYSSTNPNSFPSSTSTRARGTPRRERRIVPSKTCARSSKWDTFGVTRWLYHILKIKPFTTMKICIIEYTFFAKVGFQIWPITK